MKGTVKEDPFTSPSSSGTEDISVTYQQDPGPSAPHQTFKTEIVSLPSRFRRDHDDTDTSGNKSDTL